MYKKKFDNLNLPREILNLIQSKKNAKKMYLQYLTTHHKKRYNLCNKIVKKEIELFKSAKTTSELDKLVEKKASESKFWQCLKRLEGSNPKKVSIPYLNINNTKLYNDKEKSQAFGQNLAKIFIPYENDIFDEEFKLYVNEFNTSEEIFNYNSENKYTQKFSMDELNQALENCKVKSAAGPDKCPNKTLKALGENGKKFVLNLMNKCFIENVIPKEWKIAKIIMIKKKDDPHDINNYRPISLTNSLAKLLERLVKNRLVEFLNAEKIITKFQSGFRENRGALDNIFYFKQKCLLAFDQNHLVGGIVYDVEKAFDKIWHQGLLYKMHNIKIPNKIGKFIQNFLTNREFFVSINEQISDLFPIRTGVPQGSILSPILFAIYVNDIPLQLPNYSNLSVLLYADNLFSFYNDKNINRIKIVLQYYLNNLENWLKKWRLKVAPHKCSYNIYNKKGRCNKQMELSIFGQKINKEENPRYLGIYLDPRLNFNFHIQKIKEKCFRKLNFLKVLKSKKCPLQTKIAVYNAMVRSNMDFGAPIFTRISEQNRKKLRSIQYHSMRIILNKKYGTSSSIMSEELNINSLEEHFLNLKNRYVNKALIKNEMLADLKTELDDYLSSLICNVRKEELSIF